ncbi:MAG: sensor histidine kinase [Acidobacteria bacterium]|nr:sensor histidine kinase [Acidobacteriota bacterium]
MNIDGALAPTPDPIAASAVLLPTRPVSPCPQPPGVRPRDRVVFRGASAAAPLQHALEEQARRVAYALHDEIGQLLASVDLSVDRLREELPTADARLLTIKNMVALIDLQLRRVVYELRPTILDHLGLLAAVQALADSVRQDLGLRIVIDVTVPPQLPPDAAIALYRMVQEALTNAVRHGHAECVWIWMRPAADGVHCTVEDDGRGFDVRAATSAASGLGLLGMRERITAVGGTFTVASAPGAGTELIAIVPVEVTGCPSPSSSPTITKSCDTASADSSSAKVSRSLEKRETAT